ncbi:FkbM family methyltransferase [Nostoc sp. TCL26-01]|uniref:FkbM family methyltransferase n=1 Tax=Nostoc sp. TCL26-01 TaxID=2576904 RepID=UPI0015BBDD5B|nr:FkbM family methyltransferase [Nostoc sp. TCL26-01]QLE57212.1 FkbM family methyltransferase [Nostoc sp. TCL26-01]
MLLLKKILPSSVKHSLKNLLGLNSLQQKIVDVEQQLPTIQQKIVDVEQQLPTIQQKIVDVEQQLDTIPQKLINIEQQLDILTKSNLVTEFYIPRNRYQFNATYLGNNRVIAPHPLACHIFLDSRCILVTPQIISQAYETGIVNYLKANIKPGMKCLEIGANQGFHTLTMAFLVGSEGHVVAFEANPQTFAYLNDSIVSNGILPRVTLENKAAFDKDGVVEFKQLTRYAAGSHIALYEEDWTDSLNDGNTISIPAVDINAYLLNNNFIPNFIKIDAEGAEPYIFRSLLDVVKLNNEVKIMMEFVPGTFEFVGGLASFTQEISSLGFKFFAIDISGIIQEVTNQDVVETVGFADYIISQ